MNARQELFNYLSKELGATALETDLIAIERIVINGQKERVKCYREWDGNMKSKFNEEIILLNKIN